MQDHLALPASPKTPTMYRSWLTLLTVIGVLGGASHAQAQLLTEAEVLRRSHTHDPNVLVALKRTALVEARGISADLYPNPELAWEHEHLPGASGEMEDTVSLTLPLQLSGQRRAQQALASTDLETQRADEAGARARAAERSLALFYETLAALQKVALYEQNVASLDEVLRVLARRREAGAASGYEERRLELEAELARSELNDARLEAETRQLSLALLFQLPPEAVTLAGELTPGPMPKHETQGDVATLRHARKSLSHARTAEQHSRSAWLPQLALSGGVKRASGQEVRYGYVAGVSLSLPVFSRGQDVRAEAVAREQLAQGMVHLLERETTIAKTRAERALFLSLQELERLQRVSQTAIERLERAALAGYREGQRSVVELLDASSARLKLGLRRIELGLKARRAQLALRRASGEFE